MVRRRKLKIAQIAPIVERVPPKKYGGTERVVHALVEELVKRGHDVTLFASGDSVTSGKLISTYPRSLREARIKDLYGTNDYTMLHIGQAFAMQDQFDIFHDHIGLMSLPTANIVSTPVVQTLHGPFTRTNRRVFEALSKVNLVSISKAQAAMGRNANIVANVYNGLYFDDYPAARQPEDYLLFVGRISLEKGLHHAIEVAQTLDMPLVIAAKLDTDIEIDIDYFKRFIEPRLSDKIKWIGEVDEKTRNELMSKAYCLLHPITWQEPFGLVMVEAMACGTPVIAFDKGSAPELIDHGRTGFVVSDVDGMIEAVEKINDIERGACRQHVIERFGASRMAEAYEEVYYKVVSSK